MICRDVKTGKYLKGNKPINARDTKTGKFTKHIIVTDAVKTRYAEVVKQVDLFLDSRVAV